VNALKIVDRSNENFVIIAQRIIGQKFHEIDPKIMKKKTSTEVIAVTAGRRYQTYVENFFAPRDANKQQFLALGRFCKKACPSFRVVITDYRC
jgi:hypothetical protein